MTTTHPENVALRLLLDARAAAAALSISTRSLWSVSYPRGPVPVVRIGSRVLYAVSDLQAAIERMKGAQTDNES
jgi:hypothetical protein